MTALTARSEAAPLRDDASSRAEFLALARPAPLPGGRR